jgi:hypothetical protein
MENIACVLTTALQASIILKNYTISSLIITGHLLDQWLKCSSSIYAYFIYGQLESMILSQLYKKQMKTHLTMIETSLSKSQLKRECYRQVSSQRYYLNIVRNFGPKLDVYQDNGDRYEKVPINKVENGDHWTIPIFTDAKDKVFLFKKRIHFYLTLQRGSSGKLLIENDYFSQGMSYFIRKYLNIMSILIYPKLTTKKNRSIQRT